jgi:hypothetical protein
MMYFAASSPSQAMGPDTAGESLSGAEKAEELLRKLSLEDLGLMVCVDMVVIYDISKCCIEIRFCGMRNELLR